MGGVEDLGQEDPHRDGRGEEAVAEADALIPHGAFDGIDGEQVGEGQPGGLGEAAAGGGQLAAGAGRATMGHGGPPCLRNGSYPSA